jgi:Spy/CpxP family protein refolding chaperone
MRTTCKALLIMGLIVCLGGLAQSQQKGKGRGGFGPGGGLAGLLNNKSVQQEVKMTDEQVKKVADLVKETREKHKDDLESAKGLEGQERFQKMGEINKAINEELTKSLGDVLQPEQVKRVKQIAVQTQGVRAFSDETVQKELKLTDDQKDKIKTINDDMRQEMQSIFSGGGDREENRKKMQTLQKETMEKVSAVLTDDQKKTWKEMTGEPFEVKFEFQGKKKG